ncbi:hypothetical protein EXIGLDRAFT_742822 [Exidia glandulosa HHB12029]|uniref:BRCT domain-containing protein n=1 Tax=Exidia glandulosa HHB12029 TaxID=1314781 RepID=A0A165BF47_EXIGL|nr:hypothetical protein EXIGLDRAFT_742822 [Exidia glandulosa HHB12029]
MAPPLPEHRFLFTDPLFGTPIRFYVDKDVHNHQHVVDAIKNNGGTISPAYHPVSFILVNPHSDNTREFCRLCASKPDKVVLDAHWVHKCLEANALLAYRQNWAGLKLTGNERHHLQRQPSHHRQPHPDHTASPRPLPRVRPQTAPHAHQQQQQQQQQQPISYALQQQGPGMASMPPAYLTGYPQHPQRQQGWSDAGGIPPLATQRMVAPAPHQLVGWRQPTQQFAHAQQPQQPPGMFPGQNGHGHHFAPPPPQPHGFHQHPQAHDQYAQYDYRDAEPHWDQQQQHPHQHQPQQQQAFYPPPPPPPPQTVPQYGGPHHAAEQQQHAQHAHAHTHPQPQPQPAPAPPPQPAGYLHAPPPPPPQDVDRDLDVDMDMDMDPPMMDDNDRDDDDDDYERPRSLRSSEEPLPRPAHEEPAAASTPSRKRKRGKSSAPRVRRPDTPHDPTRLIAARAPNARSPAPPTQVLKSTYGGNIFTDADVAYLHKYIQYCQDQGMALSLREICERVSDKAPHHTFYSWRRYCNKHHIRLGAYSMIRPDERDADGELDRDSLIDEDERDRERERERDMEEEIDELDPSRNRSSEPEDAPRSNAPRTPGILPPPPPPQQQQQAPAQQPMQQQVQPLPPPPVPPQQPPPQGQAQQQQPIVPSSTPPRDRTPSPPRELYRSTTGKGVAFTDEDVKFLVDYLAYRRRKEGSNMDMVAFWRDVAQKAPHHSRASWMKYWRRHKHEIEPGDGDEPMPERPTKKMRYSKDDDMLLAQHFMTIREGTSDQVFQNFARLHPHHPWKGWQEHHRIHKSKIEEITERLKAETTAPPVPEASTSTSS